MMSSVVGTRRDGRDFVAVGALLVCAVFLSSSAAIAQEIEVEIQAPRPGDIEIEDLRPQEIDLLDPLAASAEVRKVPIPELEGPPRGQIYTWQDGDRTQRAFLQEGLVVARERSGEAPQSMIRRVGRDAIVRVASSSQALGGEVTGDPVFRSQAGSLMTLPGGVLLIFAESWNQSQIDGFFAENGITAERVSPLGALPNGFKVETEPGFASLELANSLAGKDGVRVSSPNWWRERTTR